LFCIDPLDSYAQQVRQQTRQQARQTNRTPQARQNQPKKQAPNRARKRPTTIRLPASNLSLSNLILLESNYDTWVTFLQFPKENRLPYSAIYHNPRNNSYFHATIQETNNTFFPTSSQQSPKFEQTFDQEFSERFLVYISDLPENKRVFTLSTNTNKIYIKTFKALEDTIYLDNDSALTNSDSVYPVLNTLYKVQYTNKSGQIFNRILTAEGRLRFLGPVNTSLLLPLPY
ncbi:MAG: hypothetical protein ACRC0X_07190, partial [Brevinema sp.]